MKTTDIETIIKLHLIKYPSMEIADMLKLLFQSEFGGGHLIENSELSYERILDELYNLPAASSAFSEDLGEGLSRVYLSPLRSVFTDNRLCAKIVNAIFIESASLFKGTTEGYYEKLDILLSLIEHKAFESICFLEENMRWVNDYSFSLKYINAHKEEGCPMLRHSESYRAKYNPAYRIVLNEFVQYLDLFKKIENMFKEKNRIIIAIDGKCGSGKSTLAKIISNAYNCPIIRVDDFFLPGDLRTEERLAAPGGNVHYERFLDEVIAPLNRGETEFPYRVFDCHAMEYTNTPKKISLSNIAVVEGSYSMRPEFRDAYDISVFLDAGRNVQKARIISRSNEQIYEMFEKKWIPMENRYFEHFNIASACDVIYRAD